MTVWRDVMLAVINENSYGALNNETASIWYSIALLMDVQFVYEIQHCLSLPWSKVLLTVFFEMLLEHFAFRV